MAQLRPGTQAIVAPGAAPLVVVQVSNLTTTRLPCVLKVQLLLDSETLMCVPGLTVTTSPFWAAPSVIVLGIAACAPDANDPSTRVAIVTRPNTTARGVDDRRRTLVEWKF